MRRRLSLRHKVRACKLCPFGYTTGSYRAHAKTTEHKYFTKAARAKRLHYETRRRH